MTGHLRPVEVKRLHRQWRRRTEGRVALLLDAVQTPYNVGAIFRLAAAFRVDHLWLGGRTALPSAPGARKTALGSERFVPWTHAPEVVRAIDEAKDAGFQLLGVELAHGAVPLHEAPVSEDVCIVVGHEEHGLSPVTLAACDALAYVPQLGRIGSLNVASAVAIALYETRRRAWTAPEP